MTLAEPQPIDPPVSAGGGTAVSVPLTFQCPYVSSGDGAWRAATATRDHRCAAVTPPAPVAIEKQRRLCLRPEHQSCATFVAAEAASGELPGRANGLPRPLARTTPVVLDRHRLGTALPAFLANRSTGQTVPRRRAHGRVPRRCRRAIGGGWRFTPRFAVEPADGDCEGERDGTTKPHDRPDRNAAVDAECGGDAGAQRPCKRDAKAARDQATVDDQTLDEPSVARPHRVSAGSLGNTT